MKNTIISLLKGACYLLLYFAVQTAASYFVMLGSAISAYLQNPTSLETEGEVRALIQEAAERTLAQSSLVLTIAIAMLFLILIVFFHARGKKLTQEVWLRPVRPMSLLPVVVFGAAFSVVICALLTFIPWPDALLNDYEEVYALVDENGVFAFVVSVILAPIAEELVFRGLVFTRFCRGMPAPAALLLAAIFFGAAHGTLLWMCYGIAGGIVMTLIYMKYRSLAASMVMHGVFNLFGGYLNVPLLSTSPALVILTIGAALALLGGMGLVIYRMPRASIDKVTR